MLGLALSTAGTEAMNEYQCEFLGAGESEGEISFIIQQELS